MVRMKKGLLIAIPLVSLALVLVLVPAGCKSDTTPPPTATTSGRAMAERLEDSNGLEHVARLNAGLYRGAQPEGEGFNALKAMGVKTIINLRYHHSSDEEAKKAGLNYVEIRIKANVTSRPPTDEQVKLFFDTVLDPAKQPVYFHCMVGKDRTGTMAALYRIEVDGWSNEEAIEELHSFGYHTYYKDLINFVREYKPRGFKAPESSPAIKEVLKGSFEK